MKSDSITLELGINYMSSELMFSFLGQDFVYL